MILFYTNNLLPFPTEKLKTPFKAVKGRVVPKMGCSNEADQITEQIITYLERFSVRHEPRPLLWEKAPLLGPSKTI